MRPLPLLLLAAVFLASAVSGQVPEEASPQSRLAMTSDPTAAVLTNRTTFGIGLAIDFEMGFVQCAEDPVIPLALDVSWSPPSDMILVVPPELELDGNDDLIAITEDPPYNYHDSVEGVLLIASQGLEPYSGVLNITVVFDGGTPSGCVATGPMPPAQATVLFDLQATAFAAYDEIEGGSIPAPIDDPMPEEAEPKDKDSPGAWTAGLIVAVAVALARRDR